MRGNGTFVSVEPEEGNWDESRTFPEILQKLVVRYNNTGQIIVIRFECMSGNIAILMIIEPNGEVTSNESGKLPRDFGTFNIKNNKHVL